MATSEQSQLPTVDWSARSTPEGLEQIVRQYFDWAQNFARRAVQRNPKLDRDAVSSDVSFALLRAVQNFDPAKGFAFGPFAERHIAGAIIDSMRNSDHLSRPTRRLVKQRMQAETELVEQLGRRPTVAEICTHLDWKRELYWCSLNGVLTTLEKRLGEGPETFADYVEDHRFIELADQGSFDDLMRGFSMQEKTVIYLYYFRGSPMNKVAQVMRLSEPAIWRIHNQVIERLRELPERFEG